MKKEEYIKVYQWMNVLRGGVLRDVYALLYQLGKKGDVKVTISYICERLGYKQRNVQNAIYELKDNGYIEVKYMDGKSSVYTCITHAKFASLLDEENDKEDPRKICVPNPRKICTPAKFAPLQNLRDTHAKFASPTPYISLDKNLDKNYSSSSSVGTRARERLKKWFAESDLKEWILRLEKTHQITLETDTLLNDFFDNDFQVREECERGERTAVLKHFQNWLPKYIGKLKQNTQTPTNNGNTNSHGSNKRVADLGDIAQSILAGCEAGRASRQ
ncbi:MAG: MarR family transcriptional regulator [Paludibacteraceae bacterium]